MIKIMADSTCDLSDEVLKQYDISLASLVVTIGDNTYKDRVEISPDEFYSRLETLSESPKTAMPSPTAFIDIINNGIDNGYTEFLCICMSSGTSGSYQSAVIAKETFFEENPNADIKIYVVDSKSMSHGSGYLILKSAILKEQGATFQELIDFNETYKTNIKHLLAVEDIDNLIRSGRLSNVSAMIGKMLHLNPIMSMRKGRGEIVAKVRTNKKVLNHYVKELMDRIDKDLTEFIIIGYTSDIKKAENLKLKIQNEVPYEFDIYIMQMGVAVGTHVGLGGISLYFIETGNRHDGLIYNGIRELMDKKEEMVKMLAKYRQEIRENVTKKK
jgi:DegV family protein with EDD domain